MQRLRSARGCPWDRRQTHRSLRSYLLEEAYEAVDAIDRGDLDALRGELGDVLLQCVFHAQLAAEKRRFDITAVIDGLVAKLIHRHPHVFTADGRLLPPGRARSLRTSRAVVGQWEKLKAREQERTRRPAGVLTGLPQALPALLRAHKIGSRVAAVGFDWACTADVMNKIDEELRELRAALAESEDRAREELGDLLFSVANLARKLDLEPESALREANDKFTARFAQLEEWLAARGLDVHAASLDQMEAAWAAIKKAPARRRSATSARPSISRPHAARRSRR
jgi:MazG family protein